MVIFQTAEQTINQYKGHPYFILIYTSKSVLVIIYLKEDNGYKNCFIPNS